MWHVACIGGVKNVFGILVVKPDGRDNLEHRLRMEDNIKFSQGNKL
jgi:hypothetical protein